MTILSNSLYVAGFTESTGFPVTVGSYQVNKPGNRDGFVMKLSLGLDELQACTFLGGNNIDEIKAIAVDTNIGKIYVAGYSASLNFPRSVDFGSQGGREGFISRFNSSLSTLEKSVFFRGSGNDEITSLAISTNGDVIVAGITYSVNLPVTNGYQLVSGGIPDGFIAKFNNAFASTSLLAATYLGGNAYDEITAVAIAGTNTLVSNSYVYVAGSTASTNFPRNPVDNVYYPGYTNKYKGNTDVFISALDVDTLSNLVASTYLGGTHADRCTAIAVKSPSMMGTNPVSAEIFIAGYTASTNFPVHQQAYDTSFNGNNDMFLLKMDGGLTNLLGSTFFGGSGDDRAYAMAVANDYKNIYAAGYAQNTFPVSDDAYQTTYAGGDSDCAVIKFGSALIYGGERWNYYWYGANDYFGSPALGMDGSIYIPAGSNLFALSSDGQLLWTYTAQTNLFVSDAAQLATRGLGGMPSVDTNGVIYIGNYSDNKVYAISNGAPLWTSQLGGTIYYPPAIGLNNRLYVGSGSKLYALNKYTGAQIWSCELNKQIYGAAGIDTNAKIYIATMSNLYAIADGGVNGTTQNIWSIAAGTIYGSPAISSNGIIYIGAGTNLYAFNSTDGSTSLVWNLAGTIYASPILLADGSIIACAGSNVYELAPSGATNRRWVLESPDPAFRTIRGTPSVTQDGSLIVPIDYGYLYSLHRFGWTNWVVDMGNYAAYSAPLITGDGTIYAACYDNFLALYGSNSISYGSYWPLANHDLLRSGNAAFNPRTQLKPSGLVVSKGTYYDRVVAYWDRMVLAYNYEVWRSPDSDINNASLIKKLVPTNYSDTTMTPGISYYYWIRARTPLGFSEYSDPDVGGTPPFAPLVVTASKGVPTDHVHVHWTSSTNATIYNVYRNLSNDYSNAIYIGSSPSTNFHDWTVYPGLTHYYWVRAANSAAGTSWYSATLGNTNSGGIAPLAPTVVTAWQGISESAISVYWNASTGAAPVKYWLYRATEDNPASATLLVSGLYNQYKYYDSASATPGVPYYYYLRVTNAYGLGPYSDAAVGWRMLGMPYALNVSKSGYTNQIRVSWVSNSASPATSYLIYRSTNSYTNNMTFLAEVTVSSPADTNYDDLAIQRGLTYYYWIRAKNAYTISQLRGPDYGGTPPQAPLNINASDGLTNEVFIEITWNSSVGATSYKIYRNETFDASNSVLAGVTSDTLFRDYGAEGGVFYYYWVKAAEFGESAFSSFNSGWRQMAAPQNINASDGTSTSQVTITWQNVYAATAYEVWRNTQNSTNGAIKIAHYVTTNSYSDVNAEKGTLYYYWIKAKNSSFISDFSLPDSGYKASAALDLIVSDFIYLPPYQKLGQVPSAVSFKVKNNSAVNMFGDNGWVACEFFFCTNADFFNPERISLGVMYTNLAVSAGGTRLISLNKAERGYYAQVPPYIEPGSYYVFIYVKPTYPSTFIDLTPQDAYAFRNGGALIVSTESSTPHVRNDFTGDGASDIAIYRKTDGRWRGWLRYGSTYYYATAQTHGGINMIACALDFDGDGKADPTVYEALSGTMSALLSANNYALASASGLGGGGGTLWQVAAADYDGDAKADPVVYYAPQGLWRGYLSDSGYRFAQAYGMGGDGSSAVPDDYDGDEKADPAVYYASTGTWKIWLSGSDYTETLASGLGGPGFVAVPADYDRDAKADIAIYNQTTGTWIAWLSTIDYQMVSVTGWGGTGQFAVPGDYDGDSKVDPAVFWETMSIWRIWLSSQNYSETTVIIESEPGFKPVPSIGE